MLATLEIVKAMETANLRLSACAGVDTARLSLATSNPVID